MTRRELNAALREARFVFVIVPAICDPDTGFTTVPSCATTLFG